MKRNETADRLLDHLEGCSDAENVLVPLLEDPDFFNIIVYTYLLRICQ